MALEAVSNYSDLLNFVIYETPNFNQYVYDIGTMENPCVLEKPQYTCSPVLPESQFMTSGAANRKVNLAVQGRKKRKRRPNVYSNTEEAETQRMTHIAVERNRRKLMNEHLAVLRSLMPESYAQRGDQASIVGGAIEFVKVLEHLVQSLEVQKLLLQQPENLRSGPIDTSSVIRNSKNLAPQIAELLSDPQNSFSEVGSKYTLKSEDEGAHIEVTLIETHANLRIVSKKSTSQLSKMVSGFQTLRLTILHLSVISLDPFVLYSISAKVEEGCQLTSVDSIAQAVHHMLRIIIEEQEEDASQTLTNLLVT